MDTFSYVLRSTDVTGKDVNHIRCFAIDMAKDLILLSCRLTMERLCVLQLETALATLVTTWFTLTDRRWRSRYRSSDQCIRNAFRSPERYNGWFREQLGQRFTFFNFFPMMGRTMPEIFPKKGWKVRKRGNRLLIFFSLYSRRLFLLISLTLENPLSIALSLYLRLFKWWRKSPSLWLVVSTVEHIRLS